MRKWYLSEHYMGVICMYVDTKGENNGFNMGVMSDGSERTRRSAQSAERTHIHTLCTYYDSCYCHEI